MELSLFISAEHRPDESIQQRLAEHVERVRVAKQAGFDGVAIGYNRLITRIQWLGMDQAVVLRTIELLGDKVLPMLRKASG